MALLLAPRLSRARVQEPMKRVGFSGTYDGDKYPEWVSMTRRMLRALAARGAQIVFLPFARTDDRYHRLLAAELPSRAYTLATYETPGQCLDILGSLDFHIGQRLHAVILADVAGTPNIGIAIHPKVRYYLEEQHAAERCFGPDTALEPEELEEMAQRYSQPREFMQEQQALALHAIRAVFAA
jgi:polysaccharide pyruvyl transferase WcaK-like protein